VQKQFTKIIPTYMSCCC